jgi:hypothetical protein
MPGLPSEKTQADGPLNVVVRGSRERVVFVHGSRSWGTFAFRAQLLTRSLDARRVHRRQYSGDRLDRALRSS